jgi:hypothetical protein
MGTRKSKTTFEPVKKRKNKTGGYKYAEKKPFESKWKSKLREKAK